MEIKLDNSTPILNSQSLKISKDPSNNITILINAGATRIASVGDNTKIVEEKVIKLGEADAIYYKLNNQEKNLNWVEIIATFKKNYFFILAKPSLSGVVSEAEEHNQIINSLNFSAALKKSPPTNTEFDISHWRIIVPALNTNTADNFLEISARDSKNLYTGLAEQKYGEFDVVEEQIPNSSLSKFGGQWNLILDTKDDYTIMISGKNVGKFYVKIDTGLDDGEDKATLYYPGAWSSKGTKATIKLPKFLNTNTKALVQWAAPDLLIDLDGDGKIDIRQEPTLSK